MNRHSITTNLDQDAVVSMRFGDSATDVRIPELVRVSDFCKVLERVFSHHYIESAIKDTLKSNNISFPENYKKTVEVKNEQGESSVSPQSITQKIIQDGLECDFLSLDRAVWRKGKVRIRASFKLEFCPDESSQKDSQQESSLDEIRQSLKS